MLLHQAKEARSLLLNRLRFGLFDRRFQMVKVVVRTADDLQRHRIHIQGSFRAA